MKPLVFYNIEQFTENGKDYVSLEKEEFQKIINETYNAGYNDCRESYRGNVVVTNDGHCDNNNKILEGKVRWYDPLLYNTCNCNTDATYKKTCNPPKE